MQNLVISLEVLTLVLAIFHPFLVISLVSPKKHPSKFKSIPGNTINMKFYTINIYELWKLLTIENNKGSLLYSPHFFSVFVVVFVNILVSQYLKHILQHLFLFITPTLKIINCLFKGAFGTNFLVVWSDYVKILTIFNVWKDRS